MANKADILEPWKIQPGEKRAAKNLSETQIRYAMENTLSNAAAALWLNVSRNTYKKYASMYTTENDKGEVVTLYQLHMNRYAKGIKKQRVKRWTTQHHRDTLRDIIDGKKENPYDIYRFMGKLVKAEYIIEECLHCGFNERRTIDGKVPLFMDFKDGNKKNGKLENVDILCHNCFFLLVGNKRGRQPVVKKTEEEGFDDILDTIRQM